MLVVANKASACSGHAILEGGRPTNKMIVREGSGGNSRG